MQTSAPERRPAIVSAEYPDQRYFAESGSVGRRIDGLAVEYPPTVIVWRFGRENSARLKIDVGNLGGIHVHLGPAELRRLASDLLDAAADIEGNPSAQLLAGAAQ